MIRLEDVPEANIPRPRHHVLKETLSTGAQTTFVGFMGTRILGGDARQVAIGSLLLGVGGAVVGGYNARDPRLTMQSRRSHISIHGR